MGEPEVEPEALADVIVLRNEAGAAEVVPDTPENRAKRDKTAEERRAEFMFNRAGALARASQLPRLLTAQLSAGVSNLMLVKIMQGELKPQTAKEAADIAKIAHGIFKESSGQASSTLTPQERDERMGQIDKLSGELAARAKAASEEMLGGAPEDGETVPRVELEGPDAPEPDEWEHDPPALQQ